MPPMDDRTAQTSDPVADTSTHPEEIRARVDLRIGNSVSLQARLRTTPAGLVSAGLMVSTVVLAAAALVWAARRPRIK
ncbi:MAG: hypothetical protein JO157_16645 [Acetobacteraceae bacterium]|nr:hypothetical protein [Acetobacteraceae bacterium]